jgi:hypothetical protein
VETLRIVLWAVLALAVLFALGHASGRRLLDEREGRRDGRPRNPWHNIR